jgi:hypothetical protein
MTARSDVLKDRLSRYREVKITVTGRNSGRGISMPVWLVSENENLYLLPVQGTHDGTGTFARTRQFVSMPGA